MTAGRNAMTSRRLQTFPIECLAFADRWVPYSSRRVHLSPSFLRTSETNAWYLLPANGERVSSMCAGQESKREVRDRRSVRLTRGCRAGGGVACSSLEYGGIRAATRRTPAPHDRLLLPTSPPPPHFVLLVHLRSTRFSPALISCYTLPQEHRRSPAAPSCRFLVSSAASAPTTATTTTTTMFAFLSEGYCQLVWQRDRENGQKKGSRSRE